MKSAFNNNYILLIYNNNNAVTPKRYQSVTTCYGLSPQNGAKSTKTRSPPSGLPQSSVAQSTRTRVRRGRPNPATSRGPLPSTSHPPRRIVSPPPAPRWPVFYKRNTPAPRGGAASGGGGSKFAPPPPTPRAYLTARTPPAPAPSLAPPSHALPRVTKYTAKSHIPARATHTRGAAAAFNPKQPASPRHSPLTARHGDAHRRTRNTRDLSIWGAKGLPFHPRQRETADFRHVSVTRHPPLTCTPCTCYIMGDGNARPVKPLGRATKQKAKTMPTLTAHGLTLENAGKARAIAVAAGFTPYSGQDKRGGYRVRLAVNYGNTPENLQATRDLERIAESWKKCGLISGPFATIQFGA